MAPIARAITMHTVEGKPWKAAAANARAFGKLFGREVQAEAKIAALQSAVSALQARGAQSGSAMLVFATANGASVQSIEDRFGYLYGFTGLKSAVPEVQSASEAPAKARPAPGSPEALLARKQAEQRLEQSVAANPDWIIVLDRAAATGTPEVSIQDRLAQNSAIAQSQAFKAGRVIYLDPGFWYLVGSGLEGLTRNAEAIEAVLASKR